MNRGQRARLSVGAPSERTVRWRAGSPRLGIMDNGRNVGGADTSDTLPLRHGTPTQYHWRPANADYAVSHNASSRFRKDHGGRAIAAFRFPRGAAGDR